MHDEIFNLELSKSFTKILKYLLKYFRPKISSVLQHCFFADFQGRHVTPILSHETNAYNAYLAPKAATAVAGALLCYRQSGRAAY